MNAVVEIPHQKQSLVTKFAGRYSVDPGKLLPTLKATAFKLDAGQVSDEQMMALLIVADQYGLNPFTKEIFAFPDKHKGVVPVVSVDGWARIINEHAQLDGIEFVYGPQKGAHFEWIECVIYRKDRAHPIRVREFWEEVARSTGPWQSHGNRMHRHKALIQCSRVAFGFAGIFDEDEAERIIERDVTPQKPQIGAPRAKSEPREVVIDPSGETQNHATADERLAAEGRAGTAETPPPAATEGAAGEAAASEPVPMKPSQVNILKAKMKQHGLTDVDLAAKFGKPLCEGELPNYSFPDFNRISEWINERAAS